MSRLVLLRHGESEWNKEGRFTGWTDVDLSQKGILESEKAAEELKTRGFSFDIAFTSVLKRAIRTLQVVLDGMDLMWIPVSKSWRLNERHYGALQGLYKEETAREHGRDMVHAWRRSYDLAPPPLEISDPRHPAHDTRYRTLASEEMPSTESLKDTLLRVLPYWETDLSTVLSRGRDVLVAAHGNSLRALIKHLDRISDEKIPDVEIPTGEPLVYDMEEDLSVRKRYYLNKR